MKAGYLWFVQILKLNTIYPDPVLQVSRLQV
jgi:hypothetical protein